MIENVALIGANGRLGPWVLRALVAAETQPRFKVTILSRASSRSQYAETPGQSVRLISDAPTHAELVEVLTGQDALVVSFMSNDASEELQMQLADAAVEAGVKRIIPADFGSCDSSNPVVLKTLPTLFGTKERVRRHLQKLAAQRDGAMSWTSLVCGHFFDYGLQSELLLMDVEKREVQIVDGGDVPWSATTRRKIGIAVARVLAVANEHEHEDEDPTRNKILYIQSFCLTQNQLLACVQKVVGARGGDATDWTVIPVKSSDFIAERKRRFDNDRSDIPAREELVGVLGIVDARWDQKPDFANRLLGLDQDPEVMDDVVTQVLRG